jgi:O-antigen ligase
VQIWGVLLDFWKDHRLTGSGYGSFWNVRNPQPIYQYATGARSWIVHITSGHNGYIDLLVQTGLPGLALGLVATVLAPFRRLLTSVDVLPARRGLITAIVLFSVCHNLTESSIFDRDATVHVFLMLGVALLGLGSADAAPAPGVPGPAHG